MENLNWKPTSKANYLAFTGIGGALWAMNFSRGKMCREVFCFPFEQMLKIDQEFSPQTTYSERCNAQDFFCENFSSAEELKAEFEKVKAGKADYEFSQKHHSRIGVLRAI